MKKVSQGTIWAVALGLCLANVAFQLTPLSNEPFVSWQESFAMSYGGVLVAAVTSIVTIVKHHTGD